MRRFYFVILVFHVFCMPLFGQVNYYQKDSSVYMNVELLSGNDLRNSRFCQLMDDGRLISFNPYEVSEYGFEDGRVYISKEIQIAGSPERVFLERLVNGSTALYYYRGENIKLFFLEKDTLGLVELPKYEAGTGKSYKDNLLEITDDCSGAKKAVRVASYSKTALTNYFKRYYSGQFFPQFKYGLFIGGEAAKLIAVKSNENAEISQLDFLHDPGFSFGFFLDYPLLMSNYSFHSEVFYSQHGFSSQKSVQNKDIFFIANVSTLSLPVLIRYSLPTKRIQPFFNAGGIFSYNMNNENFIYETLISENIIEGNMIEESTLISNYQMGYSVGGGLESRFGFKNTLFLELRYNHQMGMPRTGSLNTSTVNILTGIGF